MAEGEAGDGMEEAPGGGEEKRGYFVRSRFFAAPAGAPGLYVVATPIGNLGDVTIRALDTLAAADLIACEGTRVTPKLLDRYGIREGAQLRAVRAGQPQPGSLPRQRTRDRGADAAGGAGHQRPFSIEVEHGVLHVLLRLRGS